MSKHRTTVMGSTALPVDFEMARATIRAFGLAHKLASLEFGRPDLGG